jgi:FAD/FMN-containing dehydrogenase
MVSHAANGVTIGQIASNGSHNGQLQDGLARLLKQAHNCGGTFALLRASSAEDALQRLEIPETSLTLTRKLKTAFDPHELLNPGRIFSM